jgi:hypothetical protein
MAWVEPIGGCARAVASDQCHMIWLGAKADAPILVRWTTNPLPLPFFPNLSF